MERLLLVWINEREMKRDVTSMAIIQEKAREIIEKLKKQTRGVRIQGFHWLVCKV
jgi:hypothetical protein